MHESFNFRNINKALPALCGALLNRGETRGSRNGQTLEMTHVGVSLSNPRDRYITLPDRKASVAAQIAETMWILAGRNDIEWLKNYLPRAGDFSDDGVTWRAGYGARLRRWGTDPDTVDQLAYVVNLLNRDPDTRQAVMTIYDPDVDCVPGLDKPCNGPLQFLCRDGLLSLHVFVRSNDLIWGWSGINAFEWSALLEIVAGVLGFSVGSLHFSITSLHMYQPHWDRAERISAAGPPQTTYSAGPRFEARGRDLAEFDGLVEEWFAIEYGLRAGTPDENDAARAAVEDFPEPMLQSWLRVIAWYWSGAEEDLKPLAGTSLDTAVRVGIQPKREVLAPAPVARTSSEFVRFAAALHASKHAAYGDSWKRRGELIGIMANIARKIDRLGKTTDDETAADTAVDLMIYLAKYRWWLVDHTNAPYPVQRPLEDNEVDRVHTLLEDTADGTRVEDFAMFEAMLTEQFEELERAVTAAERGRWAVVDYMLQNAYSLAFGRWVVTA